MNDKMLVRVGNGRADFEEELQALGNAEGALLAVRVEPFAGDVFHDEVGKSVARDTAAVEPRDVRMIERGEDAFFLPKLPDETRASEGPLHEFQRHEAAKLQILGEVDFAHAAFAEKRTDAIAV